MTKPKATTTTSKAKASATAPTTTVVMPRRSRSRAAKPSAATPPVPSPAPVEPPAAEPTTKLEILSSLLRRTGGASVAELMAATGWQQHSVRGALAGAMKKRFGAKVVSEMVEGVRRYRAPKR